MLCFARLPLLPSAFRERLPPTRRHYEYGQERKSDCWHPICCFSFVQGRNNLHAFQNPLPQTGRVTALACYRPRLLFSVNYKVRAVPDVGLQTIQSSFLRRTSGG